jgi:protein SCO1/2
MTLRTARILVAAGAFVAGLILFVTIILLVAGRESGPAVAAIGGPFTLTDQNGGTITDRDFKGRPSLVFFGFTQCPDICPTSMFEISEVLRKLGRDGDRARALFITVDPERDTPQVLKEYLSSFDSRIVGATGSPEAIAAVAKAYRSVYRRVPLKDGGYTMDHTAVVYLMDKQGRFVSPFSLRRTTDEAAADLRRYL